MRTEWIALLLGLGLASGCSAPPAAPTQATAPKSAEPVAQHDAAAARSVPATVEAGVDAITQDGKVAAGSNVATAARDATSATGQASTVAPAAPSTPTRVSGGAPIPATLDKSQPVDPSQTTATQAGDGSARELPQDVQSYIIKRRMCAHLSHANTADAQTRAAEARMARSICPGADIDEWKALVRKYQSQDQVTSVLLAEKPAGIKSP